MAYGTYDAYLGVGKQSAKGTAVAPSTFIRYREKNINPTIEAEFYPEGGGGRKEKFGCKTYHKHDGSFSFLARPAASGLLLHALLGADAVTGSGPYAHALTPADTLPWLTIETGEVKSSNLILERIQDCVVDSARISGRAGRPVEITLDFLGTQASIQSSAPSITYEADNPYVFYQGTFTINSSANTFITEFDIEIKNNVGDVQTVNVYRDDMLPLKLEVDVSFTLKLTNATLYKSVYYGGGTSVSDTLYEGDFTVDINYGSGGGARGLKIEIPKLIYTATELPRGADPEIVYLSCHGHAIEGASQLITITVKNNVSTDYDS